MELMNCKNCKGIFNYISGDKICPKCKEVLEEKFQEVKEYVRQNPGVNITQVAEECETSVKQIKKWVREDRLAFSDDSLVGLECERCGKMIHSGRFCNECSSGLASAMTEAIRPKVTAVAQKPKTSSNGKMRFLE